MANRALKSFKFPGLPDTYLVPQQATEFKTSTAYKAGDYCIYQGELYRFKQDHAAGAWNAAHAEKAEVATDLADLVADLKAGTEATAGLHLGFYLDADGDLNQVDN